VEGISQGWKRFTRSWGTNIGLRPAPNAKALAAAEIKFAIEGTVSSVVETLTVWRNPFESTAIRGFR